MNNEIRSLKVVLMGLIFSLLSITANAQHTYIKNHKHIAEQLSQKYGVPASVILAVAFVETGGGSSKNSKTLNNHFGIVGKNTVNNSVYRSFPSVEASYEAFVKLVRNKHYYQKLQGSGDFDQWIRAIASAGYSTQPQEWMRRLKLIFSQFNLARLD